MSLGVLRCYFLHKKLCRKLMIFQGFSPNTSQCQRVHHSAWEVLSYRGRRTSASKDVLPAQHNIGQGSGSVRVIPEVCEGDMLQGSATDN